MPEKEFGGKKREKFLETYSQEVLDLAAAMQTYESIEDGLGGEEPKTALKEIMEGFKKVVDNATEEEKEQAKNFIKASRRKGY